MKIIFVNLMCVDNLEFCHEILALLDLCWKYLCYSDDPQCSVYSPQSH